MTSRSSGAAASPDVDAIVEAIRDRPREDPYAWVRTETDRHRRSHRCWAYPYEDGSVLGAIGRVVGGRASRDDRVTTGRLRVLELGTALGYTACWWGSVAEHVDTIERDPVHAQLALHHLERANVADRVSVHNGDFSAAMAALQATYDIAFFDGYAPDHEVIGDAARLLTSTGVLVLTNLDLGGVPLEQLRQHVDDTDAWQALREGDIALLWRESAPG